MKVLSIRQPWASYILADVPGWKNVENRNWPTRHRGWIYIHAAAKRPSATEKREAAEVAASAKLFMVPKDEDMKFGGIIGMVRLVDCVKRFKSPWFFGPWGWILSDPYPLPFEPCAGALSLFDYGSLPSLKPRF